MDYIKLKDKEYPFLFAIKAQKEMQQCEDLIKKDDTYFIWLGLKYGSIAEEKDFTLTEDQLIDIFELDLECFEKAATLLGSQVGKLKKAKGTLTNVLR